MRQTAIVALIPLLLGADWPQHLGPARNGHSSETGILRNWPKNGPEVLWKYELGSGWAGPVVAGEKLIQFHRAGDSESIVCLDAATGKEIWKAAYRTRYTDEFNFDDGPRSTPMIADGRIFTLGADGDLRAWDLSTGKAIWDRNLNRDYAVEKGFFGVATSPILAGGKLLINVGVKGAGVVAFSPETGKEIWRASDDGVSYSSPVVSKLAGVETAVFFTRAGLLGVDPEKGQVRFQYPWRPRIQASVNAATPIVSRDQIYISTSYGTGAIVLDVSKGKPEEIWSGDRSLSNHYNTPILVKDHLYGIDGRQEGGRAQLRCLAWDTGKVRWSHDGFGCASLIAADGIAIACRDNGDLTLFQPSHDKYMELANATVLDAPVRALPALSDGRLFVRDGKKLVAFKIGGK